MILVTSDIHFNLYFYGSKISIICFCNVQHHINFDYVISSANKTNQNILLNFLWCEKRKNEATNVLAIRLSNDVI